jgi:hypothetical protein
MPKRSLIPNRFFAFGAGVAVGFGAGIAVRTSLPRATELAGLILEKLGFEVADIFLALWDPEGAANQALLPAPQAPPAAKAARAAKVVRSAKVVSPPKKKPKNPAARRNAKPMAFAALRRRSRVPAVSSLN